MVAPPVPDGAVGDTEVEADPLQATATAKVAKSETRTTICLRIMIHLACEPVTTSA
jgi:hypothetical protein